MDDGGTPIKHFVVELCDITTNNLWTSVAMTESADQCEQTVQHLREGHKYSLRVAAVNRIGQSEPADLLEDVITKDPWGKNFQMFSLSVQSSKHSVISTTSTYFTIFSREWEKNG